MQISRNYFSHYNDRQLNLQSFLKVFVNSGIPEQQVSDNKSRFSSSDFAKFFDELGIYNSRNLIYYFKSNSKAERFVITFNDEMNASKANTFNVYVCIGIFLFRYRVTPYATTGNSPAQLHQGRAPRIKLYLIYKNLKINVFLH